MEIIKDDKIKYQNILLEMCMKECQIAEEHLNKCNERIFDLYNSIRHSNNNNEIHYMSSFDIELAELVVILELLRNFNINTLAHFIKKRHIVVPQSNCKISNEISQRRNMNPFIDEDMLSIDSENTIEQESVNDISSPDNESVLETSHSLTNNEIKDLFEEPLNTLNAMEAVMGHDPKDEERLCKFYNHNTNSCFKGNNCKKEHSLKITEGWTKDKEIIKISLQAEITYPAIGQKIKLIPTFIQTVEKFYAHLYKNPSDSVPTLRSVIIKMNSPEYICKYKLLSRLPVEHELVFALFNDDNWYRAKIISLIDENTVKVMLLDFGNIKIFDISKIREWCNHFDYLPFQAISCRLANIKKIKNYHVQAIDQLKRKILNKAMTATVVDNVDELSVFLTDDDGIDIGQLLYITKLGVLQKVNSFKTKFIPA